MTVGSVYMEKKQIPAKEILQDLVEMTKGVQSPLRGLFLRHYLCTVTKDKLPDVGSTYGEDVQISIDFLLYNFAESNRLWIRMQFQGTSTKKQRESERKELQVLAGSSLVRLSQLDGVNLEVYAQQVLPKLSTLIVGCKDCIAQAYLMDCLIHIFPDEFHIATLTELLKTCTSVQSAVNVTNILVSLIERLQAYAVSNPGILDTNDHSAFTQFEDTIHALLDTYTVSESEESVDKFAQYVELLVGLLSLAMAMETSFQNEAVTHVFKYASTFLKLHSDSHPSLLHSKGAIVQLERLVSEATTGLALQVFTFASEFNAVVSYLPITSHHRVANAFLHILLNREIILSTQHDLEHTLKFLHPILKDDVISMQGAYSGDSSASEVNFAMEQNSVAQLVHLIFHEKGSERFQLYCTARKFFGQGGTKRIPYTLVPLVFAALALLRNSDSTVVPRKVLQFVHESVTALASNTSTLAFRLFLHCALSADHAGFEAITYEFFTQAFILYEDEISVDSKEQVRAIQLMIGTLLQCTQLGSDNYDTVSTKTTQYAAKLLKKEDQCRMVAKCAHLFWTPAVNVDGARVLECLQRALKLADVCVGKATTHVDLFVELLDHYLFFYEHETPQISQNYLTGLLALIKEHLEGMEASSAKSSVQAHYTNTLLHIQNKDLQLHAAATQ